ncbi:hypothetical protein PGT21_016600 [Puccinia graminis f. sp. tritici]|uniref:Uncharacterized protein n=1 Tax=Puccinia graminis f. sp. tritici TaxID=56615 RepID=A0A5B0MUG2_PUCGR|nr:hypothetical protein PGT21_016600 [Puccinia graminis f. sp. tritici]
MCTEMQNDLKDLNEKLVAVLVLQPNSPIDRMTFVDQYFPHLSAKAAFKKFNFEERVILSSATIYRNEKYQELSNRLEVLELELTIELLPAGQSFFSLPMDEHVQNVQRKVSTNNHYQNLQSKLLQMRIKRRHLEMQVGDNGQRGMMFPALWRIQPQKQATSTITASENDEELHRIIANQTTSTALMCTAMKHDLKQLKEKLVAVPVFQPNLPVNRMNYVPAKAASEAFDLDERVVLPSAKMDPNELYQELLGHLEVHEAELTMKLLPAEHTMFLSLHQVAQRVERKISSTDSYQTLQANILQMRIKRRQLELQVKNHPSPTITCTVLPDQILEVNDEVFSSDTSGSSSLIYPKIL